MIGVDIIQTERIRNAIDRWGKRFTDRIFSPNEQLFCEKRKDPYQCYAVRFAAKESFYKAYNHPYGWKALEVIFEKKPNLHILAAGLRKELKGYKIHLSMSHTHDTGMAFVYLEKTE